MVIVFVFFHLPVGSDFGIYSLPDGACDWQPASAPSGWCLRRRCRHVKIDVIWKSSVFDYWLGGYARLNATLPLRGHIREDGNLRHILRGSVQITIHAL